MKYNLVFHIEALEEYKNASIWYELQQAGLGLVFENAVECTLKQILENPYTFSSKKTNSRKH